MSSLIIQSETLTSIADAIRAKTGNSGTLTPSQMATEISNISSGGGDGGGSSSASISSANFSRLLFIPDISSKAGLDFSSYSSYLNNKEFFYIGRIEQVTDCIAHFDGLTCVDWKCFDYQGNAAGGYLEKTDLDSSYFWAVGSAIQADSNQYIGIIVIC